MDGIHIPREIADHEQMPEDLDSATVGPYRFPDPGRRRTSAIIYLILAILVGLSIPSSIARWAAAAAVLLIAIWHWLAAWPLELQPEVALAKAAVDAPFPIGHASAALTFHGWLSRPRWHVVVYDAAAPPKERALIVIDAVDGNRVGDSYVEDIATDPS